MAGKAGGLTYQIYRFGRRFSRFPGMRALIPARVRSRVQAQLLAGAIDQLSDRRYMTEVILPAVASLHPRRLLDVGVDFYTRGYGDFFGPETERWTLDVNRSVSRHGSPGRHIEGDVLDAKRHFAEGSLDVVILNGVFGFGIDRAEDQSRVIAGLHDLLRPDGWLLIGWDRRPDGSPFAIVDDVRAADRIKDPLHVDAIGARFRHQAPAGLPPRKSFSDCAHVYDWFQAREG